MKPLLVLALALTFYFSASAAASDAVRVPTRCTAAAFKPWAERVWRAPWERGAPAPSTIRAAHRRIECAGPGNRRAMKRDWRLKKSHFFARRQHCLSGEVFAGRVSEFSGGATADGVHVATEPGIALRSESTLGQTFKLTTDAGTDYVTQTDFGPAPWTGRTIDITSAEMARMGWAPTDSWGSARLIPSGCL